MKKLVMLVLVAAVLNAVCGIALAAAPSYVFWSANGNSINLAKFDGTNLTFQDIPWSKGARLGQNMNSSGSGVSLLTCDVDGSFSAYAVNPGTYGSGQYTTDYKSSGPWIAPGGRHGGLGSALYYVNNDLTTTLVASRMAVHGRLMGDFKSDLFSVLDAATFDEKHDGTGFTIHSNYVDVVRSVTAADGAVIELGGKVYYTEQGGVDWTLVSNSTLANEIGGKAGQYGFFNLTGYGSYMVDSAGTSSVYSNTQIDGFVRVGELALISISGGSTYLFNSRDNSYSLVASAPGYLAGGVDFGDYALVNHKHPTVQDLWSTYVFRDKGTNEGGNSYEETLFASAALDLTRATGGYLVPTCSVHDLAGNDCKVDFKDLAVFASEWLQCGTPSEICY